MCEDNIDGGQITARDWSELIGLGPILCGLEILGWMPDVLGAARENHLVRSSSAVTSVVYGKGRIEYTAFDAPADSVDVLRLAFRPSRCHRRWKTRWNFAPTWTPTAGPSRACPAATGSSRFATTAPRPS